MVRHLGPPHRTSLPTATEPAPYPARDLRQLATGTSPTSTDQTRLRKADTAEVLLAAEEDLVAEAALADLEMANGLMESTFQVHPTHA